MIMLLPKRDSHIEILAKDKAWTVKIGKNIYSFNVWIERLIAYDMFVSYDKGHISGFLRIRNKNITIQEINEFMEIFRETHPLCPHPFKWDDVKPISKENEFLVIPNSFDYEAAISHDNEKYLLDLLRKRGREAVESWFERYVDRYCLTPKYKRDWSTHHLHLASTFCELHGINIGNIPEEEIILTKEDKIKEWKKLLKITLGIIVYIVVMLWCLMNEISNTGLHIFLVLLGGLMFLIPIGYLKDWIDNNLKND